MLWVHWYVLRLSCAIAVAALQKLGSVASDVKKEGACNEENEEDIHSLISLAAQLAFEVCKMKTVYF